MDTYRHTQRGTTILTLLGIGMLIVVIALGTQAGVAPLLAVLLVLAVAAVLFGSLTIEIRDGMLTWSFGPGLLHKRVRVADIQGWAVVQNPWWYGWGIRLTPNGWLYNVAGQNAVEITMKSGRRLRIGTDEPEQLSTALQRAVAEALA
jgi:hypothetical protein